MRRCFLSIILMLLMSMRAAGAGNVRLLVTVDSANLMARPSNSAESVCRASKGDILIFGDKEEQGWLSVLPPKEAGLWVYGELVKNNTIAVSMLYVRCGPGINYSEVGGLKKGDKVEIIDKRDEWFRISPPSECRLWVRRNHVDYFNGDKKQEEKKVEMPAPVATIDIVRKPVPSPLNRTPVKEIYQPDIPAVRTTEISDDNVRNDSAGIKLPPDCVLISSKAQGRDVEYTGVLSLAPPVWRRPGRYRLVKYGDNGLVTGACYVLGETEMLGPVVGCVLRVSGQEYWVQGVRDAVLRPYRIVRKK